jgi:hypothetical protein
MLHASDQAPGVYGGLPPKLDYKGPRGGKGGLRSSGGIML